MPVQNRQKFIADGVKIVRVIKVDIYLDVLVILNTYMTWLLLSVTAMICKIYPKPMNRAVASFAGGLSSLIILIPNDVKLLALTASALKILSCAGISYLAFRPRSLKKAAVLSLFGEQHAHCVGAMADRIISQCAENRARRRVYLS